jgi:hypothetical protein
VSGRILWILGALVLLASVGTPSSAQEEPLQASTAGESISLLPHASGATLELADGRRAEVPLPASATLSSLQILDRGWAAAGSTVDAAGQRHLFVLVGDSTAKGTGDVGAVHPLPEPAPPSPTTPGHERLGALLLVDHGRLAGLAWLEGDGARTLAVCAAEWDGKRWGDAVWVSRPGPGSQLGLAGAVLADGSWLLAWSAFDGQDDEIVWSRRLGGSWSKPARVSRDNAVPDITPAVVATGGGALISWSRYEPTGYRLRLARFDGNTWKEERAAAEPGSLDPSFLVDGDGRPALLYLTASPRAWTVLSLDSRGQVQQKARASSTLERPAVSFAERGAVHLRWPAAGREARVPLERAP